MIAVGWLAIALVVVLAAAALAAGPSEGPD
jgi:hypothetical protein